MEVSGIVSQILAAKDETDQLQFSSTVLRSTAIAGKVAAEKADQTPAANPPGVGDNLDITA